jgi:hypothetical protein
LLVSSVVPLNSSSNVHVQLPARPSGVVPWQGRFGLVASVDCWEVLPAPELPAFPELPEFVAEESALDVAGLAPALEPALGVVVVVAFTAWAVPQEEGDVVRWPPLPVEVEAFVPAECRPIEVAAVSVGVPVVVVAAPETSVPARQPRRRGPSSLGIVFPLPLAATAFRRHAIGGTVLPFDCA